MRIIFLGISLLFASSIAYSDALTELSPLIDQKCLEHPKVDCNLIRSIVSTESGGKATALSPAGARGVMQLMPATAERMGIPRSQLYIRERNLEAGIRYVEFLDYVFAYNKPLTLKMKRHEEISCCVCNYYCRLCDRPSAF